MTILLTSCSEGGVAGEEQLNGANLKGTRTGEIASFTDKQIVAANPICVDGVLGMSYDTAYYQISNGEMLQWRDGSCTAVLWKGANTTIQGTWVMESSSVPIPGGTPEGCDEDEDGGSDEMFLRSTVTFSGNSYTMVSETNGCYAEMVSKDSERMKVLSCNEWLLMQGQDTAKVEAIRLPSNIYEPDMLLRYTFNGKSCDYETIPDLQPTAAVCAAAWSRFQAEENDPEDWESDYFTEDPEQNTKMMTFLECWRATGFGVSEP